MKPTTDLADEAPHAKEGEREEPCSSNPLEGDLTISEAPTNGNSEPLSDLETLERFRRGESDVLTKLYRTYLKPVAIVARYGFSYQSKGEPRRFAGYANDYDQENLIQETFSRAFETRTRERYDGLTPYAFYLKGIARNIVLDGLRKAGTQKTDAHDEAIMEAADSSDYEVELGQKQQSKELDACIRVARGSLSVIEERFVALRYEKRLTQHEVAKKMKVGRSRVRTLEKRVRLKFVKALEQANLASDRSHHDGD